MRDTWWWITTTCLIYVKTSHSSSRCVWITWRGVSTAIHHLWSEADRQQRVFSETQLLGRDGKGWLCRSSLSSAAVVRRYFRGQSPLLTCWGSCCKTLANKTAEPVSRLNTVNRDPLLSCSSEWDCRHFGRFTVLDSSFVSCLATRGLDFLTLCRASKDSTTSNSQLFRGRDGKQKNSLGPKWYSSLNWTCQDVKGDSNPLMAEVLNGTKLFHSLMQTSPLLIYESMRYRRKK